MATSGIHLRHPCASVCTRWTPGPGRRVTRTANLRNVIFAPVLLQAGASNSNRETFRVPGTYLIHGNAVASWGESKGKAMKTWQKAAIGAGVVVVLGGIAWFSAYQVNKGVVAVQTGKVLKADLTSVVTASGEIRPKNYTNVLGEGIGKITEIVVKEGDHVKKGDILLRLENIQPGADVQAQQLYKEQLIAKSDYDASKATYDAAAAGLNALKAQV